VTKKEQRLNSEQRVRANVIHGRGPDDPPRKPRLTFHDIAAGEAGTVGGRFAAVSKTQLTGTVPEYPRLPTNSPWATEPVGQELPLGFDVNAVEPVGTPAEIEQSLQALGEAEGPPSLGQLDGGDARSVGCAPPASEAPSSSPTKRKSRGK
jgi:hypothetical protein